MKKLVEKESLADDNFPFLSRKAQTIEDKTTGTILVAEGIGD